MQLITSLSATATLVALVSAVNKDVASGIDLSQLPESMQNLVPSMELPLGPLKGGLGNLAELDNKDLTKYGLNDPAFSIKGVHEVIKDFLFKGLTAEEEKEYNFSEDQKVYCATVLENLVRSGEFTHSPSDMPKLLSFGMTEEETKRANLSKKQTDWFAWVLEEFIVEKSGDYASQLDRLKDFEAGAPRLGGLSGEALLGGALSGAGLSGAGLSGQPGHENGHSVSSTGTASQQPNGRETPSNSLGLATTKTQATVMYATCERKMTEETSIADAKTTEGTKTTDINTGKGAKTTSAEKQKPATTPEAGAEKSATSTGKSVNSTKGQINVGSGVRAAKDMWTVYGGAIAAAVFLLL
ncbi:hypothetical protein JCM33374_g3575 [Metschnikowia sp. JCM 33374]|nr:hypothetical protein JCM33374_g3575 [Metschnikowia sp. JCM 33374]